MGPTINDMVDQPPIITPAINGTISTTTVKPCKTALGINMNITTPLSLISPVSLNIRPGFAVSHLNMINNTGSLCQLIGH